MKQHKKKSLEFVWQGFLDIKTRAKKNVCIPFEKRKKK
jgi:hypothetical protein